MATRKRNEFLDFDGSDGDESDRGYDSEAIEESKGRSSKRRKILDKQQQQQQQQHTDGEDEDGYNDTNPDADADAGADTEFNAEYNNDASRTDESKSNAKEKPIKIQNKSAKKKKDKTGVVYFSSLPPYLKPFALKSLLLQRGFGPITRVFLNPAVPSTSGNGKRGNKRKMYSDGWVEFESKKVAKLCAEALNANIVGGKGWYRDDVLNLKYLRGFKWADLMEQVQRERSEREARRRIEDARARKEDKVFLSGVEKGKVIEGIRKKRENKAKANDTTADESANDIQIRRVFRQNEVKQKEEGKELNTLGEDARRVLGKIF